MQRLCWLLRNGVPWDVIMDLDPVEATAMTIIFGQQRGKKFDFSTMSWVE